MYALRDENLVAWDPSQLFPTVSGAIVTSSAVIQNTACAFKSKIKKYLKDVQIDAR